MTEDAESRSSRKIVARRREREGPSAASTFEGWAIDIFLGLVAIVLISGALFAVGFWIRSPTPLWLAIPMSALILGVGFGREQPGARGRWALLASVTLVLLLLAGNYVIGTFVAVDKQTAKSLGDGVISSIEEFRSAQGRYPEELATAGIEAPRTRLCAWKYEARSQGHAFRLDVEGYLFEVFYDSTVRCWQTSDF